MVPTNSLNIIVRDIIVRGISIFKVWWAGARRAEIQATEFILSWKETGKTKNELIKTERRQATEFIFL